MGKVRKDGEVRSIKTKTCESKSGELEGQLWGVNMTPVYGRKET